MGAMTRINLAIWTAVLTLTPAWAGDRWPSFRGAHAAGVAQNQNLPDRWSAESGEGVLWKRPIPGLAHASPIVWDDKVFTATAAKDGDPSYFREGLYGDGTTAEDLKEKHKWSLYCLDRKTGKVLWQRVAREGLPRSGRHIKATHANCSPAADGKRVIAFFGSEGLYAYDMDGNPLWSRDLGELDLGAYNAPDYKWGYSSSPILYQDKVFVQCDTLKEDFIMALDAKDGKTLWRTARDELPSWSTPTIYPGEKRAVLLTNAPNWIMGHDPQTGKELWRLGGSSKITAPTPIFDKDLIVIASGRRPVKPIFALRAGANGDITLPEGETASEAVVWSSRGRGPYMPTPLIYGDYLYTLNNNGVFDCYELQTGKEVYRQRVQHGGSGFSASPVAADGKIYLSSEDGDIFVIAAGPAYKQVAVNDLGELLMATPAIAGGAMFVRGRNHLFAIGR